MREKMAREMYHRMIERSSYVILGAQDAARSMHAWEHQSAKLHEDWFAAADAALDALLEPTEGMIAAYDKTPWPHDDGPEMPDAYQNMIRAAKDGK